MSYEDILTPFKTTQLLVQLCVDVLLSLISDILFCLSSKLGLVCLTVIIPAAFDLPQVECRRIAYLFFWDVL